MKTLTRLWVEGTVVAGTLDLLSAFVFSGSKGIGPLRVLQSVASGPLGHRALEVPALAIAGLITHYAIMSVMVAVFLVAALRLPFLTRKPVAWGMVYGFGLWIVMYWIVLPLRFPTMPTPAARGAIAIVEELISHVILVGIAIGMIVGRGVAARRG